MQKHLTNGRRAQLGQLKRARTRRAILEAAVCVLGSAEGRVAGIDDVMNAAGMARGTFYNYFESRDALFAVLAYELSHSFNTAVLEVVNAEEDPSAWACFAVRYYLNKARADRSWGWAVVNVSLNSPTLFGDETANEVQRTITQGLQSGAFSVALPEAGCDLMLGATLTATIKMLQSDPEEGYAEEVALLVLRGLGVGYAKARLLADTPLPALSAYAAPFSQWQDE
jgi:AcrR family transcriptional regulator